MIELLMAFDEVEPPPFEVVTASASLGEPVVFRYGVAHWVPPCLEVGAVRPDGSSPILRPDRPRAPGGVSGLIGSTPRERVVQDWLAIDAPGTWTVTFVHRGKDCRDTEPTRLAVPVEVLPPEDSVSAGATSWSAVGVAPLREDLLRLAQAGVPGGARGLAGIPDRAATDALIALLDHPVAEVVRAAADGLSYRVPRPQIPDDTTWSQRTWRPEHLAEVTAWLERTRAPARATDRLRVAVDCVRAPTDDCAWRR